jgi:predicted DNA-binding transcriptional regulator AlpA
VSTPNVAPREVPASNRLAEDFCTEDQLCELLDITPRTLHRWNVIKKAPPRIKAGRTILYRRSAVAEWLQKREQHFEEKRCSARSGVRR